MSSLFSPETMREHRVNWFVYAGGERIPFQGTMRGTWDFDATCTCGWDSKLGGGTRTAIRRAIEDHRHEAEQDREIAAAGYDPTDPRSVIAYYREVKGVTL